MRKIPSNVPSARLRNMRAACLRGILSKHRDSSINSPDASWLSRYFGLFWGGIPKGGHFKTTSNGLDQRLVGHHSRLCYFIIRINPRNSVSLKFSFSVATQVWIRKTVLTVYFIQNSLIKIIATHLTMLHYLVHLSKIIVVLLKHSLILTTNLWGYVYVCEYRLSRPPLG